MKIDPRKIQKMMSQMGISQEDIDAKRVIIEKSDGSKIIIEPCQVTKINMHGQESFQITGDAKEEKPGIPEQDIKQVVEKTNCTEEEAKKALEKTNGDLAEAILSLS